MSRKRKFLTILSVLAVVVLVAIGINERLENSRASTSTFMEMVSLTDKSLIEFSEVDERWLGGEETDENYEEAWYDLNFKLEEVKRLDDQLKSPPRKLEETLKTFRRGFYRVFKVTNDIVDYLSGETEDPSIIIKDRENFEEGLELLREVKDKMGLSEDLI